MKQIIESMFRFVLPSAFVLLAACGEKVSNGNDPNQANKNPQVNVAKKQELIQPSSRFGTEKNVYFYDPEGKRNPFEPYNLKQDNVVNIVESPLEKYQLAELSLVGIIWGIADPRGMIKAPDGETYVVRRMSRIGRNKGKVARVARDSVYVEEEYRDPASGNIALKETRIELEKDNVDALSGGLKADD
ncbi:MAG TPA: pilus assembly protein PilP [Oligoflexia bacterium]|nr:pilus assembly protein PilP [Oligoflexia bacterium]HMR25734.1 pilus assembly protein PilP [Oligoflexia bacterium]